MGHGKELRFYPVQNGVTENRKKKEGIQILSDFVIFICTEMGI